MDLGSYKNFAIGEMKMLMMILPLCTTTKQQWNRNLCGILTMIMFSNLVVGAMIVVSFSLDFILTKRLSS